MQNIDFSRIQSYDGSQNKGFEEMVCQLAKLSKPENAKEFIRKEGAGGDAGVECYWKLQDGSEHAWQAKYFLSPLRTSQWRQISRSVESALSKHPALTKYYICLPRDRGDSRRSSKKRKEITSEFDKWNQHVQKWKAMAAKKSMQVEFEYWGAHEILLMLQRGTDDFAGIAKSWIGTPIHSTDVYPYRNFPIDIVDKKIKEETDKLCKSRSFEEFDSKQSALVLGRSLVEGELSAGTEAVRRKSLAWCARFLSRTEEVDKAEEYLRLAKELGTCQEVDIADAFISSQKGDKNAALNALANIDSPMSRSAALMVVVNHHGPQEAIDWLEAVGFDATNLDSDGKRLLLGCQLELADWEAAQRSVDSLTHDDLRDAPLLHHMVAVTHLLRAVPDEFRSVVLNQPPFWAVDFPLASDLAALEDRRTAHRSFINAAKVARELVCPLAEKIADEYALWLELVDPDKCGAGRMRLESKLREPRTALHLVRFGLQFGIKLDLGVVEREIERQIALKGKITYGAASARLALVLFQQTPDVIANYIAQHYDELATHFDKKQMQFLQIEMLSRAGQLEKANECLDILLEEGLSKVEESRLRTIIAEAEGTSTVETRKGQFKNTDSLIDLANLVSELAVERDWEGLCEYSEILFERTLALHDAEVFALASYNTQKNERLAKFLESNKTFLAQSDKLQLLYCWSLYLEGDLLEARSELAALSDDWDNPNYRALQINLAVSLGDWNSLSVLVANECTEKSKRSAQELISTAQLAFHSDLPLAEELIFAAVEKGRDDAGVLGTAYFLATNAGWEDEPEVSQWIQKAASLSGEDGPLKGITMKDLLDRKPEWDQRISEISLRLIRGELPMYLAARALNKTLIDLMLFPTFVNPTESDPRRRGAIFAYSGQRQPTPFNTGGQIGIDATALLTLSFLNLLDEALDAFDAVYIPHSTLSWLFEEKQKVAFHQPSRIRAAHRVSHLIATDALEKLSPSAVPDSDLSDQVGDELALFIAEAEKVRDEDDSPRIVVQSSPVHRVASLMEEEADLTAHATVLGSCQSIVEKLWQKGQITASEEQKARAYFQLHEKPWPDQPEIADGAILYLDNLAIDHFLHLGILEKLKTAGFRPIISSEKVSEANQLILYENISGKIKDAIERIRFAVNSRIKSGKIKVDRRINADQTTDRSISEHPTAGVFSLARHCDSIIIDDRFLNQHANIGDDDAPTPIFSTLDLIDALVSTGAKTAEERREYRTQLRRAGYFLIPVSDDELAHHLDVSTVENGKVDETAELKAIRENLLCVRMKTWLQLEKEETWLNTLQQVFSRVLRGLWKSGTDFSSARVRSDWIMAQIHIRSWVHCFGKEIGDNMVKTGCGAYIPLLLMPPVDVPRQVKDEYWSWAEERILAPIKEQYPKLYLDLVECYRRRIADVADMDMIEGMRNDE